MRDIKKKSTTAKSNFTNVSLSYCCGIFETTEHGNRISQVVIHNLIQKLNTMMNIFLLQLHWTWTSQANEGKHFFFNIKLKWKEFKLKTCCQLARKKTVFFFSALHALIIVYRWEILKCVVAKETKNKSRLTHINRPKCI